MRTRFRRLNARIFLFSLFLTLFTIQVNGARLPSEAFSSCLQLAMTDFLGNRTVHQIRLNPSSVDLILENRGNEVAEHESIRVGSETYQTTARLGDSTSVVSLATNSNGTTVVTKRLNNLSWGYVLTYEDLISRYYAEKGLDLPKVLGIDDARGVIVKSYEKGLTLSELRLNSHSLFLGSSSDVNMLEIALAQEKKRITQIHGGFRIWIQKNFPHISDEFLQKADRLIRLGDLKDDNFIFSIEKKRWILIDP